jgi:hypothetical protein
MDTLCDYVRVVFVNLSWNCNRTVPAVRNLFGTVSEPVPVLTWNLTGNETVRMLGTRASYEILHNITSRAVREIEKERKREREKRKEII